MQRWQHDNTPLSRTGVQEVMQALGRNTNVTHFIFRHIGEEWALEEIAAMVAANSSLEALELDFCLQDTRNAHAFVRGCGALGDALRGNASLKRIEIESVPIGDEGAQALAPGLGQTTRLEHFVPSNCCVGPAGCAALLEAYATIGTLRSVNFWNCSLGVDGCRALRNLLWKTCTLHTLQLGQSGVCDQGARLLAEGLAKCASPVRVDLTCNHLNADSGILLAKAIRANPLIRGLAGAYNHFDRRRMLPHVLASKGILYCVGIHRDKHFQRNIQRVADMKSLVIKLALIFLKQFPQLVVLNIIDQFDDACVLSFRQKNNKLTDIRHSIDSICAD